MQSVCFNVSSCIVPSIQLQLPDYLGYESDDCPSVRSMDGYSSVCVNLNWPR